MEQKQTYKNRLVLTDRQQLTLEGVEHVGKFNDGIINLVTNMGMLTLKGQQLHITELNLENGVLAVQGFISSLEFSDAKGAKGGPRGTKDMWQRIFK